MKRISAFVVAAALTAPVFAADDLCDVNLQKLTDNSAVISTLGSPLKEQVEEHLKAAKEAQAAGDLKECGSHAEQALQMLKGPNGDTNTDAG
ncbi:hypothetical protein [Pseudomonas segetis]|uniref:Small metal-binding protein n=1 Tax=Pseudomonas segetis TaxID=298908 RepID=A0A239GR03_9PSED|nr:hypothetical protein [Pseudomonas segetis]SNS71659.1 hypothetical protein SAMN05216255_3112 [Pseudomonas segetis]